MQTDNQTVQSIDEQLGNITKKVADKILSCENILVALSQDPSVDEISAAIGLTMVLNKIGKHVTAIYSGNTPNALEFLKPDETFEKNTNSLQDFIIAISKDKADHLRYKVEGDYVKVYITPYKTTISQNDLEFSQGDFNVNLVVAIDVESAEALDGALEEYGRIMHDATAINITTNQAGRFAELEWSDPSISSCCEMIVRLCEYLNYTEFDQATATALLTGIVSATERFSNARTTSETMQISSRLMQAGADQQLISSNIMQPEEPEPNQEVPAAPETPAAQEASIPENPVAPTNEPLIPAPSLPIMDNAPVAPAQPVVPEVPIAPEQQLEQMVAAPATSVGMPTALANELENATPDIPVAPEIPAAPQIPIIPESPVAPAQPVVSEMPATPDYGAMIDQALTEAASVPNNPAMQASPVVPTQVPEAATIPDMQFVPSAPIAPISPVEQVVPTTPTAPIAPEVAPAPVEVPNQNSTIDLPPPPAPTISEVGMPPVVAEAPEPVAIPTTPIAPIIPGASVTSAAPVAPETPGLADPSAFQIPNA